MRSVFKHVIIGLFCVSSSVCFAQLVSERQAIDIAFRFFNECYPERSQISIMSMNVAADDIYVWEQGYVNYMYAINMPDSGWVLVAGDKRSVPILAVSNKGTFPAKEDMPPAMLWLLQDYVKQIKFIQDSCQLVSVNADWYGIENGSYFEKKIFAGSRSVYNGTPLLERPNRGAVCWNQSLNSSLSCVKSYNKYCPDWYTPSCGHTYAGCTAVAMAQIMWYWQWPHTGMIYSGIDMNGNGTGTMELHLYDWDKMPTELTDATPMEEVDMVAGFLRDCGYAAKMKYGQDGSGASLSDAKDALINTFGYSDEITYKQKNFFSWNWKGRIKNNIDDGCPVLYAGYGSGGHAFVVDGYNSDDQFHINWGWRGLYNGYFRLDNLTPPEHDYNSDHEALFGIQPAPACGSASVNGGNNYRVGVAGEVSVSNLTVPSGQTAVYYSGTSVRLLPGFHASAGSHTHVAIQNFPCSGIAPLSARSADHGDDLEQKTDLLSLERPSVSETLVVYPNPTGGNLTVESSKLINQLELYGLDGEKQMESQGTTIDLHPLQVGMYILVVRFSDGTTRSCKVAKSL